VLCHFANLIIAQFFPERGHDIPSISNNHDSFFQAQGGLFQIPCTIGHQISHYTMTTYTIGFKNLLAGQRIALIIAPIIAGTKQKKAQKVKNLLEHNFLKKTCESKEHSNNIPGILKVYNFVVLSRKISF